MKRLLAFLLAVLCIVSIFTGCKQKEQTPSNEKIPVTNNDTAKEYDIPVNEDLKYDISFEEYITLPDLTAMELTYRTMEADEKGIDKQIYNLLLQKAERTEVTDRPVQEGDVVTVNYTCVLYGTDEQVSDQKNVEIAVGQEMAIPDLEKAIVGMSIGETKNADIVYPADYTSSSVLANAKTTFTIELIKVETADLPELNEETIKSFGFDVDTEEELREFIAAWIEQENSLYKQDSLYKTLVQQAVLVSMPENEYNYYIEKFDNNTQASADATGVSLESYINTNYGTQEAYETARIQSAQDNIKKDLVIYSLKEKYNIEVTKEEYNEALNVTFNSEAASLGITDIEDFYDKMGVSVYKMELNYQVIEAAAKDVPDKD